MKDLVHRSPLNMPLDGGYQPGCGLCRGCNAKPGEAYYDDGRLLCEDCLIEAELDEPLGDIDG